MKNLEINQMENLTGGNFSDTVTGACAGIGLSAAIKLITLSRAAAVGVAVVCAGNGAGRYFGFW